jgi:hypothetical protein
MRRFFAALLAVAVIASCVQMQLNNAQIYADQAQRIAASCPAAGQAAQEARAAADAAQQAYGEYSAEAATLDTVESRVAAAQAALAQAEADLRSAELALGSAEAARDGRSADTDRVLQACRQHAECLNQHAGETISGMSYCLGTGEDLCPCDSWRECRTRIAQLERGSEDEVAAARQRRDDARKRLDAAAQELRDAQGPVAAQSDKVNAALATVREREQAAYDAMQAAGEACDIALIGIPETARGDYNQDIYGSQGVGLRAGCPVAMQGSCAAIASGCLVGCGPPGAPTACSPGAPAGCLACFAAGCI